MSENMLPFGGTAVADRPAQAEPVVDDHVAGDDRKKLLYALVGVGVLVLAVVAFFLLKSGGSTPAAVAGGVVPSHPAAAGQPAAAPAAAAPVTLPRKVKAPEGRDPFHALAVAETAPAAAPSAGASAAASAPAAPTTTNVTTGGSSSTGSTTAATTHPVWIELRSVTATTASFYIGYSNGKTMTYRSFRGVKAPKQGSKTIFATSFALLGINNGQVAIQYGDGSPFILDMTHNYMVVG